MNDNHRNNLLKLADYLESLPENYGHFDMFRYASHQGDCDLPQDVNIMAATAPQDFLSNCGTVACAVGHGPAAGIMPSPKLLADTELQNFPDFSWNDYVQEAFGIRLDGMVENHFDQDVHRQEHLRFDFMFGSKWSHWDNSHYGAAARIRYYLDTGLVHLVLGETMQRYAPYRKGNRKEVTA
jgi:hypothetical protein